MQTGHYHNDHQSQREFERQRRPSDGVQSTQESTEYVPRRGGTAADSGEQSGWYEVVSSDGSVTVSKRSGGGGTTFDVKVDQSGVYSYDLGINADPVITVSSGDVVRFIAGANITLNRVGTDITISAVGAGSYTFNIQANGGATEAVGNADTLNFVGINLLTVTRSGKTLTFDVPNTGWSFSAVGTPGSHTVVTGGSMVFAASGGLTVSRVGNTITYGNTPYVFNVQVNGGSLEPIENGTSLNFVQGGAVTLSRSGQTITISSPDYTYGWNLQVNSDPSVAVVNTNTVRFIQGSNIVITRTGTDVTISAAAYPDYDFSVADGTGSSTVLDGNTVTYLGQNGLTVTLNTGTKTFTFNRPLTYRRTSDTDVVQFTSTAAITQVSYENSTTAKPETYAKRVWFDVTEPVAGQLKVEAWYEDDAGAGAYQFYVGANGESPGALVANGGLVRISQGSGTVVSRSGTDFTVTSPLTIKAENVASGGDDTTAINFDNPPVTTTDVQASVVLVNDGGGQRTVKIYVPSSLGYSSWSLAVNGVTRETIESGETVDFVAGTNISLTGTGRQVVINNTYSYGFTIEAEDTPGTGAVVNGANIKLTHGQGLRITRRTTDDIHFEINAGGDPPWGPDGVKKRVKSGYIEFPNDNVDQYGNIPYLFGKRKYVDIVHNWNLANLNRFHLELVDVQINDAGNLVHWKEFRDANNNLMTLQRFIAIPNWAAINANVIRVYGTMAMFPANPAITMKFRYNLVEL